MSGAPKRPGRPAGPGPEEDALGGLIKKFEEYAKSVAEAVGSARSGELALGAEVRRLEGELRRATARAADLRLRLGALERASLAVREAAREANRGREVERVARGSNLGRHEVLVPEHIMAMPTESIEALQRALDEEALFKRREAEAKEAE